MGISISPPYKLTEYFIKLKVSIMLYKKRSYYTLDSKLGDRSAMINSHPWFSSRNHILTNVDQKPTPQNSTLLQAFEWNVPADGKHWKRLLGQLEALKHIGVSNIWLPPGCKGSSPEGNGYDIYDLWDLGPLYPAASALNGVSRQTDWI
jgi:hypothetical protein